MTYQISEHKLAAIIERAVEAGTGKILTELGLKKSQISQRETFRRFGAPRVKRWREKGLIVPVKIGNKIYYDVNKLETLSTVNDLIYD